MDGWMASNWLMSCGEWLGRYKIHKQDIRKSRLEPPGQELMLVRSCPQEQLVDRTSLGKPQLGS